MWAFLLSTEMAPFTGALALVAGLVCLELVSLILGGSLFGADADGPDLDAGLDGDFDSEFGAGLDADSALDVDGPGGGLGDAAEADAATGAVGAGGVLGWIGLREAPLILWLAGVAAAFGLAGYGLQLGVAGAFGAPLPALIAALLAVIPGLIGGKIFAAAIARITPRTESAAISRRRLGGRRGVITQGTAAAGRPAECRVTDGHGNTHYIRVVPHKADETIPQGTDVIVLKPKDGIFPVIPFGDA